ncbi:MAG: hypothetical protein FD131_715 [Rhodocyclaceae bacterium]|nr:MAG: hypothetical protein FD131_715 [Rhodocyclaceae bacterium]
MISAGGFRVAEASKDGLLNLPLVQLYLHTMTNGVLGGDNSKMSVLEKLARLALEN